MTNIAGLWASHYEYGQGPDNTPQISEHTLRFDYDDATGQWVGGSWQGEEFPAEELSLVVRQNGNEFSGEWHERTDPNGYYKGREFNGIVLLVLNAKGDEMNGKWLGTSSTTRKVKVGAWTLKKIVDQDQSD